MDPGILNINVYRGSGFRQHMVSYGPNKVPDNFNGYGAELVILDRNKNIQLKVTSADDAIVFGTELGTIDILLTETQTNGLQEGAFDYYLNLLPPVGPSIRFLMGRIVIA